MRFDEMGYMGQNGWEQEKEVEAIGRDFADKGVRLVLHCLVLLRPKIPTRVMMVDFS